MRKSSFFAVGRTLSGRRGEAIDLRQCTAPAGPTFPIFIKCRARASTVRPSVGTRTILFRFKKRERRATPNQTLESGGGLFFYCARENGLRMTIDRPRRHLMRRSLSRRTLTD